MPSVAKDFALTMDGNYTVYYGSDKSFIINASIESVPDVFNNSTYKKDTYYLTPRPALSYIADSTYDNIGRGSVYWPETGAAYHCVGERIYKTTSAFAVSEITSAGTRFGIGSSTSDDDFECRIKTTEVRGGTKYMCFQVSKFNGSAWASSELWTMTSGHVIAKVTDADFPANAMPGLAELDGYLFVITSDGAIYNSDLSNPTSWAGDYLSTTRQADRATTIARHLNYIVAFGDRSIEFFYYAGNSVGSPLSRVDGAFLAIGCISPHSLATVDNGIALVARSLDSGYYVGILDGMEVKKISTNIVERTLRSLTEAEIRQIYAYIVHKNGHDHYVMQIPGSSQHTLVFNVGTKTWTIWSNGTVTGRFPMTGFCNWQVAASTYGIGTAGTHSAVNSGKEFFLLKDIAQDAPYNGATTDLAIIVGTGNLNFDKPESKFLDYVNVLFEFPTTTDTHTFDFSTSQDNGHTWSNREQKSITGNNSLLGNVTWRQLGRFKNCLLWFKFSLNSTDAGTSHRFYKYNMGIRLGTYGV